LKELIENVLIEGKAFIFHGRKRKRMRKGSRRWRAYWFGGSRVLLELASLLKEMSPSAT
jgi:hypothetical protein